MLEDATGVVRPVGRVFQFPRRGELRMKFGQLFRSRRHGKAIPRKTSTQRKPLQLEALEDRTVLSTMPGSPFLPPQASPVAIFATELHNLAQFGLFAGLHAGATGQIGVNQHVTNLLNRAVS